METRILDKGLKVSAIGLGCMGLSHANGAPTEENEAVRLLREAVDKTQPLMDYLTHLGKEKNATLGQLSLAWMTNKTPWIVPIPGTRKSSRLKENAGAGDIRLTAEEVAGIDLLLPL